MQLYACMKYQGRAADVAHLVVLDLLVHRVLLGSGQKLCPKWTGRQSQPDLHRSQEKLWTFALRFGKAFTQRHFRRKTRQHRYFICILESPEMGLPRHPDRWWAVLPEERATASRADSESRQSAAAQTPPGHQSPALCITSAIAAL